MTIFELHYDNGLSYEDNVTINLYYSTYEIARIAMDTFEKTYPDAKPDYNDEDATLYINEFEVDTQKRTLVYKRRAFVRKQVAMPCESSTLGDIDAMSSFRKKLAI